MFTSLTYQDKQAFFSLLDEYFASRPNLLSSHIAPQPQSDTASAMAGLQSLNRFLSPPPPPSSSSPTSPSIPKTEKELLAEAKEKEKEAQRVEMASKLAQKGVKHGTAGAQRSVGLISRSNVAMGALDKYGAGNIVRGADSMMNRKKPEVEGQNGGQTSPPPIQDKNKGGVSGLVSGKSFGHVDTGSKMSAFTSMWKDPQKAQTPTVETYIPRAIETQRTNLPPPVRRTNGSSGSIPTSTSQPPVDQAEGQAQAVYDYSSADSGDLTVQTGQIVNVLEKTSDDWWTCEDGNGRRGLVPANYLKEI